MKKLAPDNVLRQAFPIHDLGEVAAKRGDREQRAREYYEESLAMREQGRAGRPRRGGQPGRRWRAGPRRDGSGTASARARLERAAAKLQAERRARSRGSTRWRCIAWAGAATGTGQAKDAVDAAVRGGARARTPARPPGEREPRDAGRIRARATRRSRAPARTAEIGRGEVRPGVRRDRAIAGPRTARAGLGARDEALRRAAASRRSCLFTSQPGAGHRAHGAPSSEGELAR
jgi:hypothetical protein